MKTQGIYIPKFVYILTQRSNTKTFKDLWGNYSKFMCGLAQNLFIYPWFKKCHFTHLE